MEYKIMNAAIVVIVGATLILGITLGRVFMRNEVSKSCEVAGTFVNGDSGYTCKKIEK